MIFFIYLFVTVQIVFQAYAFLFHKSGFAAGLVGKGTADVGRQGVDVGEGGDLLSTGEKQLLSFARAILTDPAIFVLDEATSSVDTETEKRIQEAIVRLMAGRTSFVIAHRLSTIRQADVILVVKNGRIVEQGKHRELLARKGYYYRLYTRQYQEEALTESALA